MALVASDHSKGAGGVVSPKAISDAHDQPIAAFKNCVVFPQLQSKRDQSMTAPA